MPGLLFAAPCVPEKFVVPAVIIVYLRPVTKPPAATMPGLTNAVYADEFTPVVTVLSEYNSNVLYVKGLT